MHTICEDINIVEIGHIDDEYGGDDGYEVWDYAEQIANSNGIYIASGQELKFAAMDGDTVAGAIWVGMDFDHDTDAYVYDFTIAVDKKYRGVSRIGPKLIDAMLDDFELVKSDLERVFIRVWVINPKLAHWLEYRRGFEVEAEHGDGSAHMTYYGK